MSMIVIMCPIVWIASPISKPLCDFHSRIKRYAVDFSANLKDLLLAFPLRLVKSIQNIAARGTKGPLLC